MNEQASSQQSAEQRTGAERCLCREFIDRLQDCLGVSPSVRQHLANSRIELLKAIRVAIDERIEHLSNRGKQGTKVAVE